jgi:hypothetical protein
MVKNYQDYLNEAKEQYVSYTIKNFFDLLNNYSMEL